MPNVPVGEKYVKLLDNMRKAMMNAAQPFVDRKKTSIRGEKETQICDDLLYCATIIDQMSGGDKAIEADSDVQLEQHWNKVRTELREYLTGRNGGENHQLFTDSAKETLKVLDEYQPVYEELLTVMKHSTRIKQDYAQGLEEPKMEAQYQRTGATGHAPTVDELCSLSATDTPVEQLFDKMLWMATMDFRGYNMVNRYDDLKGNFLKDTFNRLNHELADAPMDRQMDFLECWNRHMVKSRDEAYTLYDWEKGLPPLTEEREAKAMTALAKSPEFERCEIMKEWARCYNQTWMSALMIYDEKPLPNVDARTNRRGNKEIGDLLGGQMTRFLRDKRLEEQVAQHNIGRYGAEFRSSGFESAEHPISKLATAYAVLVKDKRDASETFQNMRDALQDFARLDHRAVADPADYRNKLNAAKKAVDEYLAAHPGNRSTEKGKERQALANTFREVLGAWQEPQVQQAAQPEPGAVYDYLKNVAPQLEQIAQVLHNTESVTSRDSKQFIAMRDAVNHMEKAMKELPPKEGFTAELAAAMTEKMEKLSVTAKAYQDAKENQPKNERRQLRYDLAVSTARLAAQHTEALRKTGDPRYSYADTLQQTRHALAERMLDDLKTREPGDVQLVESSEAFRRTAAGMTVQEMRSAMGDRRQMKELFQSMVQNSIAIQKEQQRGGVQQEQANPVLRQDALRR